MATINELQDEVVEEFQDFTDWMDKYHVGMRVIYHDREYTDKVDITPTLPAEATSVRTEEQTTATSRKDKVSDRLT